MMVLVHFDLAPVGDLVGFAVPGKQCLALLVLEDQQRLPASGAVDAQTGHLKAPAPGLIPDIGQLPELAALEEAFPDVGHATLHLGLVLEVAGPGRIGDKSPVLGVSQEAPGEGGVQGVGHRHSRRAIVDDQVAGNATEKCPG